MCMGFLRLYANDQTDRSKRHLVLFCFFFVFIKLQQREESSMLRTDG